MSQTKPQMRSPSLDCFALLAMTDGAASMTASPWTSRQSHAHGPSRGVVRRRSYDSRGALDADNVNRKFRPDRGKFRRYERHRQTLTNPMTVAARSREPDAPPIAPNRLIARGVRIGRVHFEGDELMRRRRTLALDQCLLASDEIAFVPGDPTVHAGHPRGIDLSELGRPDPEALFEPQRVESDISILGHAEVLAGFEQQTAQHRMVQRIAIDLIAEFAGNREPADLGADQSDVDYRAAHERQCCVGNILIRQPCQEFAGFWP